MKKTPHYLPLLEHLLSFAQLFGTACLYDGELEHW